MTTPLADRDPLDALATSLLVFDWICADAHRRGEADIALTEGLIAQGVLSPADEVLEISACCRGDGRVIGVVLVLDDSECGPQEIRLTLGGQAAPVAA